MKTLLPESGMMSFRKEMDRLLDRFWDGDELPNLGAWTPTIDVFETRENLTIKAEVPGIDPKDIHLTLENGILILRGEKRQDFERKDEKFYKAERSYGSFVRSIRLPGVMDIAKVNATFHNGVLTIVVPKTAEARGLEIPIQVA